MGIDKGDNGLIVVRTKEANHRAKRYDVDANDKLKLAKVGETREIQEK